MNLTIEASELRAMVARVKPVRSPRQPWLGRLTASPYGGVKLVSVGFYLSAEAWGSGTIAEALDAGIPLAKLEAWLGGVDGPVTVTDDGATLSVEAEGAELSLFPVREGDIRIPGEPDTEAVIPAEVWAAIPKVAWAADRIGDNPPSWKNMIHVEPTRVWATNSYVLAVVTLPGEGAEKVSLFPDVAAVAKLMDFDTLVTKRDGKGRLHLRDGAGRFVVSTYAEDIPVPVDQFLTNSRTRAVHQLTLPTKKLAEAVAHLRQLKAADSDRIVIRPWTEDSDVILEVETDDGLLATRSLVPEDSTGEPPAIGLNAGYLDALLDSLDCDQVTFNLGGDRDAVVVDDGPLTVVAMSIQVSAKARPEKKKRAA